MKKKWKCEIVGEFKTAIKAKTILFELTLYGTRIHNICCIRKQLLKHTVHSLKCQHYKTTHLTSFPRIKIAIRHNNLLRQYP